ncbi:MAG: hypothetical protein A2541_02940 [Candidatus Taylorbacteria bacterium RIFOXYD2_FULL_36_9]|uniref:Ribosomal RNA small subunit methyltransferase E n=1 Tax=Candidatus Taylorbacteria bacterium RIFOXYD2_FULL_36_9 TaxID=1802338 RepID=A0A1G2PEX0_9BACT|nr:MAG: hypothetical protein A2541_02940 [Candidatus Taylorbacteria bacterium RIFOXYD2_FULL_36_9]
MRLHRFYIVQKIEGEELTISDSELIHQLMKVFRFKVGSKIIVFDGTGVDHEAEIISLTKKEVILKIKLVNQGIYLTDQNHISLYLSLIKKSNFELAVEKCTEIGVSEIHPVLSERSEKKDLNFERLGKIIKEACEQSGRTVLPEIFPIRDLEIAVSHAVKNNKFCIAFHTGETDCDSQADFEHNRPGSHHLPSPTQDSSLEKEESQKVAAFVGPEGGWSESEIKLFKKNKFSICSLGHNILRAETAAIVSVWEAFHR